MPEITLLVTVVTEIVILILNPSYPPNVPERHHKHLDHSLSFRLICDTPYRKRPDGGLRTQQTQTIAREIKFWHHGPSVI